MSAPPEGRRLSISERSLQSLYDLVNEADEKNLLGTCREDPSPYCRVCWAMEEAQELLLDDDGDVA